MITLKKNERLIQAGVLGLRAPTGEVVENVKLYEIVEIEPGTPSAALTPGEIAVCDAALRFMAAELGNHVKRCERALATA